MNATQIWMAELSIVSHANLGEAACLNALRARSWPTEGRMWIGYAMEDAMTILTLEALLAPPEPEPVEEPINPDIALAGETLTTALRAVTKLHDLIADMPGYELEQIAGFMDGSKLLNGRMRRLAVVNSGAREIIRTQGRF